MRAAHFTGLGDPSILRIIDGRRVPPGAREVQLRVTSAGLEPRRRELPARPLPREVAGSESERLRRRRRRDRRRERRPRVARRRSGRRPALVLRRRARRRLCRVDDGPGRRARRDPANVADRDAGSIWMQCLTAWGALVEIAEIGGDDWVVVPAASSSVGIASIQLCRARGAKVIATTTSAAKVEALRRFAPDAIVDTRAEPYVERVQAITGGRGARVIFDPIYGPIVNDHIRVACREAIVFVYGALDATPLELGLGGMLRKQIVFKATRSDRSSPTRRGGRARSARSRRCSSAATSRRSSTRTSRSPKSRTRTAISSRTDRSAKSSSSRSRPA